MRIPYSIGTCCSALVVLSLFLLLIDETKAISVESEIRGRIEILEPGGGSAQGTLFGIRRQGARHRVSGPSLGGFGEDNRDAAFVELLIQLVNDDVLNVMTTGMTQAERDTPSDVAIFYDVQREVIVDFQVATNATYSINGSLGASGSSASSRLLFRDLTADLDVLRLSGPEPTISGSGLLVAGHSYSFKAEALVNQETDEAFSHTADWDITLQVSEIPEPTTSALALAALCLAMSRRRAF